MGITGSTEGRGADNPIDLGGDLVLPVLLVAFRDVAPNITICCGLFVYGSTRFPIDANKLGSRRRAMVFFGVPPKHLFLLATITATVDVR